MPERHKSPRRVLILGATSGIAMAVARLLAAQGANLFLVARSEPRMKAVAFDLLARGAATVHGRTVDLDETADHPALLADAAQTLGGIDLALIAHGVLGDQRESEQHYDAAARVFHTNLLSAVSLVTWLANYFETQHAGTIAAISSVAGDRGRKSNYVYGASKGGLNVFLDGVRNRVDRAGVHVLTIRPGFVATAMTAHLPKSALFAEPTQVAASILRAVARRKDVAYIPAFWAPVMFAVRSIPQTIFKRLNL